ncbi:MAG: CHAT domain-containing protein [Caldilineaceae bacterium]|nr:CHAT domain-containing protein [Caldilineaceae bacterium]HRJ42248.1 CHAT domain-containing protein [Caldilineaceae bacterium]
MSEITTQRAELAKLDYNAQALDTTVADVLTKLYSVWEEVSAADQDAIQARRRGLAAALTGEGISGEETERLLVEFLRVLEAIDSVVRLAYTELKRGKQTQTFRSGSGKGASAAVLDALSAAPPTGGDPLLDAGEAVPYHTKVDFPTTISSRDESIHPLILQLVIKKPDASRADEIVPLPFVDENRPELVEVHLTAPAFAETTGVTHRTLVVWKGDDSEPAIFLLKLTDKSSGDKELRLDFYHLGYPVGTATFKTEISLFNTGGATGPRIQPGGRPIVRTAGRPGIGNRPGLLSAQPEAPPLENQGSAALTEGIDGIQFVSPGTAVPDVILRVVRDTDDKTLHFKLLSPQSKIGYRERSMGSVALQRLKDPTQLLADSFADLDQMARNAGLGLGETEALDYMDTTIGLGVNLYEQIFPKELKNEYWRLQELREAGTIRTLLILSDEPWIPWEMIYPFDDEHGADDFLAGAWRLTRWQAGRGLNPTLNIRTVQMITPSLDLEFVKEESDYFAQLPGTPLPIAVAQPITTRGDFLSQIKVGGVQLLHFATHGNFNAKNADRSPILLEGGESIAPIDLNSFRTQGIRKERPIVFLNACHGGKLEFTLTGTGGWAAQMVNQVAATAFVGAYWEINDRLASLFSRTFYDALRADAPLAEAFHQARMAVRADSPANPTWLAYTLYGDPNARIRWAEAEQNDQ